MRFFLWIFFGVFLLSPLFLIPLFLGGTTISLSIYGYHYNGVGFHPFALGGIVLMWSLSLTGYSLLWGKSWGIYLGLLQGTLGILIPISSFLVSLYLGGFHIPGELILFIPWTIHLYKIKGQWLKE